jgi:hypothetical protein
MSRGAGGGRAGRGHGKGSRTGRGTKVARDNRANQLNPEHHSYWMSRGRSGSSDGRGRGSTKGSGSDDPWMTKEAASRIQGHADRSGRNQGFKSRAQAAADKNEEEDSS